MPERLGDYVVLEALGEGGQGEVSRARHVTTGEIVALKQIWLGRDVDRAGAIKQQWKREARLLTAIRDPRVAGLIQVAEDPQATLRDPYGCLLIAYELISGTTLFQQLRNSSPTQMEAASCIIALCEGLTHLHQQGIYHRDINPKNVMLRNGAYSEPVYIDFGNVKIEGGTTYTRTGAHMTTRGYAPPEAFWALEKIREKKFDHARWDQWSLARTSLDCLVVANGGEAAEISLARETELVGELERDAPIVAKALRPAFERDPGKRYESVQVFAKALRDALFVDNSPIELTPQIGETIRQSLSHVLAAPLDLTSFSANESIFSLSGALFRRRTQLVIWKDNQKRLRAAFVGRNSTAVATIRRLGEELDSWLADAGDSVSVILFDRARWGSEPTRYLDQVLGDSRDSVGRNPNARFILSRLAQTKAGVYFAVPEPLSASELRLIIRGEMGRLDSLLNLWRKAIAVEGQLEA